jgi:prophage regulatory protein
LGINELTRSQMQILRCPEVQARTGLARSSIYAAIAAGTFPPPIKLSARTVGWIESDVIAWFEERVAASRG